MAKGFKHGAGGVSNGLNFEVVCNPQPANPKENTLWINTDVKITGYDFSVKEPTLPFEGMVWFPTGTTSSFEINVLKKNSIHVYPMSAKQYINGTWEEKTAQGYRNGEWVNLVVFLYNLGNECTNITGGWFTTAKSCTSSYENGTNPTIAKNDSSITISLSNSGTVRKAGALHMGEDVEFTKYSKLCVEFSQIKASGTLTGNRGARVCVSVANRNNTYWETNAAAIEKLSYGAAKTDVNIIVELNVEKLTGLYDVYIGLTSFTENTSHSISATISRMYLK